MFNNEYYKGKKVLVTGGGSGIGYAISAQFLKHGAEVFIASRKPERIQHALESLSGFGNCHGGVLDIRQPEQIENLVNEMKNAGFDKIDILINNAGGQFPSPAEAISNNGWASVINNNLNGTFYVTQSIAKHFFIPQNSGCIVNIIANIYKGFPGMAHTGAARAGVDNLTKTLSIEWAKYNIRINAVAPGIIQSSGLDQYPPDFLKGINDTIPVKRTGTVDEVAYPVLFLSSNYASYITGETLYVDGGNRLWGDMWKI